MLKGSRVVRGEGNQVRCAGCGNDAFIEAHRLEAFPDSSWLATDDRVWVCVLCGDTVDHRAWMAGDLP